MADPADFSVRSSHRCGCICRLAPRSRGLSSPGLADCEEVLARPPPSVNAAGGCLRGRRSRRQNVAVRSLQSHDDSTMPAPADRCLRLQSRAPISFLSIYVVPARSVHARRLSTSRAHPLPVPVNTASPGVPRPQLTRDPAAVYSTRRSRCGRVRMTARACYWAADCVRTPLTGPMTRNQPPVDPVACLGRARNVHMAWSVPGLQAAGARPSSSKPQLWTPRSERPECRGGGLVVSFSCHPPRLRSTALLMLIRPRSARRTVPDRDLVEARRFMRPNVRR